MIVITLSKTGDFGGSFNKLEFEIQLRSKDITRNLQDVTESSDTIEAIFHGTDPLAQSDLDKVTECVAVHQGISPLTQPVVLDDSLGLQRVHATPRPPDLNTFFSSASDSSGAGDGSNLLMFRMLNTDPSKYVDLTYSETILIKDGHVSHIDAPLGSYISAEIYTPDGLTKVGAFVSKALLLGTERVPFDTEDYGTLPVGYRLRLTVNNSTGIGDQDPPANFKVVARVEMFRANTV